MPELFRETPGIIREIRQQNLEKRRLGMAEAQARESMALRERELGSREKSERVRLKLQVMENSISRIVKAGQATSDPRVRQELKGQWEAEITKWANDSDTGEYIRNMIKPHEAMLDQKSPELTEALTETGETILTPKREGLITKPAPEKKYPSAISEFKEIHGRLPKNQQEYFDFVKGKQKESMTTAELTKRALKGDVEAKAILDDMQKARIDVAKATGAAMAAGRTEAVDVSGVARAIVEGRENMENVKNTFGVPVQEIVRSEVLRLDPEFNFNKPRVRIAGIKSSLMQQQKQRGMMGSFVKNLTKQLDRTDEMMKDVISRIGVRAIDLPMREIKTRVKGSGHEKALEAYLIEISNEIGKLSTGSAASIRELSTDAQERWAKIHDPNLSFKQLKIILDETRKMADMRLESTDNEITETMGLLDNIREERKEPEQKPSGRFRILKVE